MIHDDDAEDQYRIREPAEVDISVALGHPDPWGPLIVFLLLLVMAGTISALVIEATANGGH